MKNSGVQIQAHKQNFMFQMRLACLLEMPSSDFSKLVNEIESNPLFIKLRYSDDPQLRAIRSRRLKQTDLSMKFFQLKEEIIHDSSGSVSADIEKLFESKSRLIESIRKIGEEKFKQHFILNDTDFSIEKIAQDCGISVDEAKQMLALVNTVDMYSEFADSAPIAAQGISYNLVAEIAQGDNGFDIRFISAHWAKSVYDIDYDKIEKLKSSGVFTKNEQAELKKLIEKAELVNIRKSVMHGVLSGIIKKQSQYLSSHGSEKLKPFLQNELADKINVHPSVISRAVNGRSILTPWGEEKPVKEFFVSEEPEKKNKALSCIKQIIKEEKRPLTDNQISNILKHSYGINIASRTVAKYRTELNIVSSYKRR